MDIKLPMVGTNEHAIIFESHPVAMKKFQGIQLYISYSFIIKNFQFFQNEKNVYFAESKG